MTLPAAYEKYESEQEFWIFMGENIHQPDADDHEIYEFSSIKEFIKFRRKFPQKMKDHCLYTFQKHKYGHEKEVLATSEYFKDFVKKIRATGIEF